MFGGRIWTWVPLWWAYRKHAFPPPPQADVADAKSAFNDAVVKLQRSVRIGKWKSDRMLRAVTEMRGERYVNGNGNGDDH